MVTLDAIIRSYLITHGKNTLHGYVRLMKYLIDFLRGFSMDYHFMDHSDVLELDEKKAVQFPSDMIALKRLAWRNGDRIICFEPDSRIDIHVDREEDMVSGTANMPYDVFQAWPYRGGALVDNTSSDGATVGLGLGDNGLGYFRISWKDREIRFDANVPAPWGIYIEYKSNGFNPKSKSSIPEFAQKLAEEYIHWQVARSKFGDAAAETMARKKSYSDEQYELLARMDNLDYEGLIGSRARSTDVNKFAH